MGDNQSCKLCSHEDGRVPIAAEAQSIVFKAAGDTAGLTIKGQIRKAARALGYSDGNWRIRAAWYGDAECWSARALDDLRNRYHAWDARQGRLADAAAETLAVLDRAGIQSETDRNAEFRKARVERMAREARLAAAHRRAGGG